jgi:hypothetical protein
MINQIIIEERPNFHLLNNLMRKNRDNKLSL